MKLVECVPNFSEGRDKAKIDAIVAAARAVPGVRILDVESDKDHHRSVLTFVGPPEAAAEAAFRVAAKSRDLIDLNVHKGEHPRMGAVDVVPFIPVKDATLEDCVALAAQVGERIGRELQVPVFLYGHAARRPERQDLAAVRKGQYEGLKTAIGADPARDPDFGPKRIHPTAGATAVGAREQIINFNVNLDTNDLEAGKQIAKTIRTSGGGLPALRAKEIQLGDGRVQISTVLTDYRKTGISAVLNAVMTEARARGADLVSTEIVGLTPRQPLVDYAGEALKVVNFDAKAQILEEKLEALEPDWQESAARVADALASKSPTPGGGSAACVAGAMGAALGVMAMRISLESKKLDPARRPKLEEAAAALAAARADLERLAGEDAGAFDSVMAAYRLPKDSADRGARIEAALAEAAAVPLATARRAAEALALVSGAAGLAIGTVGSDMNCAMHLLRAAARCAAENVRINTGSLKDRERAAKLDKDVDAVLAVV